MAVAMAPAETRHEVAGQIARISRLAEDLLDYAKPWQLRRGPLDIAARLREMLRRWPEVELASSLQQPCWIDADAMRVEQALNTLLANARTAAGSQRVWIDLERITPEESGQTGGQVALHVCDNGPGIPPDIRERLFEPFASRSPGGTGLGLAIVARIMAAHGGSVALTERPPWTTCFTLRFAAAPAPASTPITA
jgi:signal transduction histidine kinase